MENKKLCTKCNKIKSLDEFYNSKKSKYGKSFYCKKCSAIVGKEHYELNRDKMGYKKFVPVINEKTGLKKCSTCQKEFPATLEYFYKHKGNTPPLTYVCKSCRQKESIERFLKDLGGNKNLYDILLEKQSGVCAICKKEDSTLNRRLAIDHDHDTGNIRGLLCSRCNMALGLFNDNKVLLKTALKYLTKNE